ncbi:hypothetical protein WCE00_01860 [Acinetobacter haemolyticus]|uniref:hypothetical protein n=1 Tax=Acinetobacter haemolyticus TaxID=29430 RepID=UPI0034D77C18
MSTIIIDTVVTTTNVLTTGTQGPVGPRGPAGDPALIEQLQTQISVLASTKLDAADYVQHFRGLFTSYINLSTQVPVAIDGDYAHIKENETFGVMEAIWDSADEKWVISAVNVGSNTDAVAEGSTNLYFTSERVRQTTLNGLDTSNLAQISPTDTVVQALGKAQAQLNNANSSIEWVDMSVVGNVPAYITDQGIFFVRWNGLLVAKMKFRCGQVGFNFPILTITNNLYKVKGTSSRFLFGRIGAENSASATRDVDIEILPSGEQSLYFANTSISTTNTYRINWLVIGELLN